MPELSGPAVRLDARVDARDVELALTVGEGELLAVITAAVAAMLGAEMAQAAEPEAPISDGFVVRSFRRVGSAPAWGRAGREEQVYSRL